MASSILLEHHPEEVSAGLLVTSIWATSRVIMGSRPRGSCCYSARVDVWAVTRSRVNIKKEEECRVWRNTVGIMGWGRGNQFKQTDFQWEGNLEQAHMWGTLLLMGKGQVEMEGGRKRRRNIHAKILTDIGQTEDEKLKGVGQWGQRSACNSWVRKREPQTTEAIVELWHLYEVLKHAQQIHRSCAGGDPFKMTCTLLTCMMCHGCDVNIRLCVWPGSSTFSLHTKRNHIYIQSMCFVLKTRDSCLREHKNTGCVGGWMILPFWWGLTSHNCLWLLWELKAATCTVTVWR